VEDGGEGSDGGEAGEGLGSGYGDKGDGHEDA